MCFAAHEREGEGEGESVHDFAHLHSSGVHVWMCVFASPHLLLVLVFARICVRAFVWMIFWGFFAWLRVHAKQACALHL